MNHRFGLYDAVLIKDNHIGVAGSITAAVDRARASLGKRFPIQVEVDTLEQLDEALACGVTSVLLDNMAPELLRRAVAASPIAAAISRPRAASRSRTCAPSPKPASIRSRSAG